MAWNIARGRAGLDAALKLVRARAEQYMAPPLENAAIREVLSYAAGSKGKMIRPRLLLLSAQLSPEFSQHSENLIQAAAMVELIHMASLIHDDIIDDAPSRRGKPTVQAKFGKDVAVYTGDFLLARVLRLSAGEQFRPVHTRYADALEHICLGEIGQDLNRYNAQVTVEQYLEHIRGKTAALFLISCGAGAELAECGAETVARMESIGEMLGMLFQLRDDLLDFTAGEAVLGKPAQMDFVEGVYTLPVLLARDNPATRRQMNRLMAQNTGAGCDRAALKQVARLVADSGALEETKARMERYRREISALAGDLPECESKTLLLELAEELTNA